MKDRFFRIDASYILDIKVIVPVRFRIGNKNYEGFVEGNINKDSVKEIK